MRNLPIRPLPSYPNYTTHPTPLTTTSDVVEHRVSPRPSTRNRVGPSVAFLVVLAIVLWWREPSSDSPSSALASNHWPSISTVLLVGAVLLVVPRWSVLYQSVTPLPGLGVQLATTRGFNLGTEWPVSTSRQFVPLADVTTVVIHEGLRRWSVRYYLGIVRRRAMVVVAFDDVNPHPAVLEEVYHGVREALFDEYASEEEDVEVDEAKE